MAAALLLNMRSPSYPHFPGWSARALDRTALNASPNSAEESVNVSQYRCDCISYQQRKTARAALALEIPPHSCFDSLIILRLGSLYCSFIKII